VFCSLVLGICVAFFGNISEKNLSLLNSKIIFIVVWNKNSKMG
jgi:hypothetical protein